MSVLNRNDKGGLILPVVANRPKTISVSELGLTLQPDNLGKAVNFLSLLPPPTLFMAQLEFLAVKSRRYCGAA